MNRKLMILSAVAALCLAGSSLRADTILLNENFNELVPTGSSAFTSVGAFSATTGNVDLVGTDGAASGWAYLVVAPESGVAVDLDGSMQGTLQSNSAFTLTPGTNYYLSFDLVGSQRGNNTSTTVTFGSYSQTFNLASGDVIDGIVTNALVTVSSPESAKLTFTSNTPGFMGALLDDVVLDSSSAPAPTPSATPEPSSLLLMGSGLSALAAWARRRVRI